MINTFKKCNSIFSKCKFTKKCKLYNKEGEVCNKHGGNFGEGRMATCWVDNEYGGEHLK